jgi:hypothetical protein
MGACRIRSLLDIVQVHQRLEGGVNMRTRLLVGTLAALAALAFVIPAEAIVINGVDYALFGRCKIGMENGPISIDGNVAVNEICGTQQGFLHIAINNVITGSATANNMFFGTNAQVGTCNYNNSTGGNPNAVCAAQNTPINPPLPITAWPPLPVPTVTPGNTDVVCPPDCNPAPGNYRDIRVKDNGTMNLSPGVYEARSFKVGSGGTVNGNNAEVNLTGSFGTEGVATINDVKITSIFGQNVLPIGSTAEVMEPGLGAHLNNVVLYAPFARMHLHLGGVYTNFEGIAVLIAVEPIIVQNEERAVCACIGNVTKGEGTLLLTDGCHLNAPNLNFFVAPTCPTDPATCPGCTAATRLPGATDTTATLQTPAVAPGTYRVVVQSTGGSFCTNATVSLP